MSETYMPNEKELLDTLIHEYVNIQRIKHAPDKDSEIAYQERILKSRLHAMGITDVSELNP